MAPPRPPELRSLPPSWLRPAACTRGSAGCEMGWRWPGSLGMPTEPPGMLSQPHPGSPVPTPGSPAWPPAPEHHGVGPVWAPQTPPGLGTPTPSTRPPAGLKTPMGGIALSHAELRGSPGAPGPPRVPQGHPGGDLGPGTEPPWDSGPGGAGGRAGKGRRLGRLRLLLGADRLFYIKAGGGICCSRWYFNGQPGSWSLGEACFTLFGVVTNKFN